MVEATRIGTIFAHDAKQAARWHSQRMRRLHPERPVGLTGSDLEQAVMGLAQMFPDNVIHGTA